MVREYHLMKSKAIDCGLDRDRHSEAKERERERDRMTKDNEHARSCCLVLKSHFVTHC